MPSLRNKEGELTIDLRNSDGIPESLIQYALAHGKDIQGVRTGGLYESAVKSCVHCHAQIVLNPDRTRSRGYCRRCDAYICDACTEIASHGDGTWVPFEKVLDDLQNAAYHAHE